MCFLRFSLFLKIVKKNKFETKITIHESTNRLKEAIKCSPVSTRVRSTTKIKILEYKKFDASKSKDIMLIFNPR